MTVYIQFLRSTMWFNRLHSHSFSLSRCIQMQKKWIPWKHVHQSYSLGGSMRFCCYILYYQLNDQHKCVQLKLPTWPNSINWQVCYNSLQIWEPRLSQLVQLLQSRVRSSIPRSSRIRSAWLVWKVLKWVPFASGRVELVRYWIIHKYSPTLRMDVTNI